MEKSMWPEEPEVVHVDPDSPLGRVIAKTVAQINACFPEGRKFKARLRSPPNPTPID